MRNSRRSCRHTRRRASSRFAVELAPLSHSRREASGDSRQNQQRIHPAICFLVLCLFRIQKSMKVGDVQRYFNSACQLHRVGTFPLRMKRLRLRFCHLRCLGLHFCGARQFQQPHCLPESGEPLVQLCDFGLKLLKIRRSHLFAGFHKLIDLLLNFTRFGFQPLIFCVDP